MRSFRPVLVSGLLCAAALLSLAACSSAAPKVDPKAQAFCDAYKNAQVAVDTDFNQHPDLFQKAADLAPDYIKAAAEQVVQERTAAAGQSSTTQGALDGLTPSGIKVQTYCMGFWNGGQ